jgi:hypothetical protein
MRLNEFEAAGPVLSVDLPLDAIELLVGIAESRFKARKFSVDVAKRNSALGDHHANIHELRGTDRDSPGRPYPTKASHHTKHALSTRAMRVDTGRAFGGIRKP